MTDAIRDRAAKDLVHVRADGSERRYHTRALVEAMVERHGGSWYCDLRPDWERSWLCDNCGMENVDSESVCDNCLESGP